MAILLINGNYFFLRVLLLVTFLLAEALVVFVLEVPVLRAVFFLGAAGAGILFANFFATSRAACFMLF
jgi:hypothetical protein